MYLNHNQITEIKGLETLTNLETLYLDTNKITEIKGLGHLEKLKLIYLSFNPIEGDFKKDIMGAEEVKEFLKTYM